MVSCMRSQTGRLALVVAAFAAIAAVGLAASMPVDASIVTGRITGVAIPAAGTGQTFVRAVSLQTGEVLATDDADSAGRYRLSVPKGAYALFPTVVTLRKVFAPKPTKVRLRRAQRKSVRVPARLAAAVRRPIAALPDGSFTGGTGEFAPLNRGLRDMLITDLLDARVAGCDISIVERSPRFTDFRGAELALSRAGLVDPATALRPGLIINPTRGVRGTIAVSGGRMTLTAEVYKWSSKATLRRTSVEGAVEEFFQLEPVLVRKLAALLCDEPPPITGTFSGSLDYSHVPFSQATGTLTWNGSLELVPDNVPVGLPPQFGGPSETYHARTGTLNARVQVTSVTDGCTLSGQAAVDVVAFSAGSTVPVLALMDGNPDTYQLALDGGLAQVPTVTSGCPQAGATGYWPLRGILLLASSQTYPTATLGVFSGSGTGSRPGIDDGYSWTWSLRG